MAAACRDGLLRPAPAVTGCFTTAAGATNAFAWLARFSRRCCTLPPQSARQDAHPGAALGVRRRTPATTTAKSACTPRPPSNCCLSRRLVAPADAHRHYPMRVSINLPLGVSVLLMPASAAFSVVAEGSNFTTCGVDLWFESRAWVLPLRPIPLRCSGTRGFVICYVKWTGLLLRNERRDTDTGSATPAHCTFSAAFQQRTLCCFSAEKSTCSPRPSS